MNRSQKLEPSGALTIALIAAFALSGSVLGDGRSDTLLGFAEGGSSLARSRTWNGAAWRSEESTPDLGKEPEWVVTADCPTRLEIALATLDSDKDVNLVFYDGYTWGSTTEVTIDTDVWQERSFYLAYEQLSGDLLIAYWDKASAKVGYRTWNGTTLSSQSTLTLPENKKLHFLTLTSKPGSDEIMLVCLNDNKRIYGAAWSGTAWGTVTELEDNCGQTLVEPYAFAYEQQSGTGLVTYCDGSNDPGYRTWNGTTWSVHANTPTVNKKQRYHRLAADPASDEIILGTLDDDKDLNVTVWSGSSWGSALEIDDNLKDRDARYFDIAYEAGGNEALVVYGENGADTPRYRTWNGTAWSAEQSGPDVGDQPIVIQLRTGAEPGEVFIAMTDNGTDLNVMRWDGSSMSANTEITGSLGGDKVYEPFMIAVAPVANLLQVAVDPSSLTAQEAARKNQFELWGYKVNLIDESDTQTNFNTAVAENHVAYIPEDVVSTNLGTKLLAAPIGVVIEEGDCYDAFGLTQDNVTSVTTTALTVANYAHYITQPFATGSLTICASSQPMNKVSQAVSNGGQILATWSGGGYSLVALEGWGRLVDSTRAAGRRVFLPVGDGAFDWSGLNANGLTIVKRSIEWGRGLMAHWKLDETSGTTAADTLGGFDATLTLMDPATDWTEGRTGGGLDFDGVNDRAAATATLRPPVEGTVIFWLRIPGSPASHGRILGLHDNWEVRHVTTGTGDGTPYGLVFDLGWSGPNSGFVTTTTVDQANRWYHVVATYSQIDGTYAVYLDGVLHKSGTGTLTVPDGGPITLGTRTGSTNYFVGVLDDVRILNHVVEADEVEGLRHTGMPRVVTWYEEKPQ